MVGRFDHFNAQFMSEHSRIGEEWLSSEVGVNVCAAHTDSANAHTDIVLFEISARRSVTEVEMSRFTENDLVHSGSLPGLRTPEPVILSDESPRSARVASASCCIFATTSGY